MAVNDIVDKLRKARGDYEQERDWCKFLLDAYTGSGGFAGSVKPPAVSTLGWVASAYGMTGGAFVDEVESTSYLDQYPREDRAKYLARVALSHYSNYVETILDLLISYALKHEPTIEDLPPQVAEWRENVTTNGAPFREVMRQVFARRSGLLGWCPVLMDREDVPEGTSVGKLREEGKRQDPWLVPLTPVNVLDWAEDDDGLLLWAKFRVDYRRQPDPLVPAQPVEQYKIYFPDRLMCWEVVEDKVTKHWEASHPFGVVPMVSFKHKPAFGETFRGSSMVADASIAARRLFNLDSELDEHLRSNVFALLQVPVEPGREAPTEVIGGTGSAVAVPSNATQGYGYVAPPASVADTLERRIENTIREIMRRARTRFGQKEAGANQSGESKAWDFEETNRLLGDFTAQLADSERAVYVLAAKFYDVKDDAIAKIRVLPPTDFAVEDLAAEIDQATDALQADLGRTAEKLIKRRLVSRVLPNMTTEDAASVDDELEEMAQEEAIMKAADAEVAAAPGQGSEIPDDLDEVDPKAKAGVK